MKDTNFRIEVIAAIKFAYVENGVSPDTLRLTKLKAFDLCNCTMDELGPEFLDTIFIDGPIAVLEDWGIYGLKVEWLSDSDSSKMRACNMGATTDKVDKETKTVTKRAKRRTT